MLPWTPGAAVFLTFRLEHWKRLFETLHYNVQAAVATSHWWTYWGSFITLKANLGCVQQRKEPEARADHSLEIMSDELHHHNSKRSKQLLSLIPSLALPN
jgi:hypothetical protein